MLLSFLFSFFQFFFFFSIFSPPKYYNQLHNKCCTLAIHLKVHYFYHQKHFKIHPQFRNMTKLNDAARESEKDTITSESMAKMHLWVPFHSLFISSHRPFPFQDESFHAVLAAMEQGNVKRLKIKSTIVFTNTSSFHFHFFLIFQNTSLYKK